MSPAASGYAPGDEVLRCQPFAYVVAQSQHEQLCDQCLRDAQADADNAADAVSASASSSIVEVAPLKRCSGCKYVHYCGPSCQRAAWAEHKAECKYLRQVAPFVPTDTVRLMARIILKQRRQKDDADPEAAELPDGSRRAFPDLMSHEAELKGHAPSMEAFDAFFEVLKRCFKDRMPEKEDVLGIFGRIVTNSFNLMNQVFVPIGIGLYLPASALDHSCAPNAAVVFDGKTLILRCTRPADSFADLRIAYTSVAKDTVTRQKSLRERYHFNCNCEACRDVNNLDRKKINSLKCPSCSSCLSLDEEADEQICENCNKELSTDVIDKFLELKDKVREQINSDEPLEVFYQSFEEMNAIFHPYDLEFLQVLEKAYEYQIDLGHWQAAFDIAKEIRTAYELYYPECDTSSFMQLLNLGKLAYYLELNVSAEQYLTRAEKALLITHGKQSRLYKQNFQPLMEKVQLDLRKAVSFAGNQQQKEASKKSTTKKEANGSPDSGMAR